MLDTDHLSEITRDSVIGRRLVERLDAASSTVCLSIVAVEEQLRGRLSQISRHRDLKSSLPVYYRLQLFLLALSAWQIAPWTDRAVEIFEQLSKDRLRVGTADLKIASIALAQNATLLSRNLRDFQRIPNLNVEDWLA